MSQRGRSLLVAVLLLDGEVEQAWAEATAGGCRRDQWLELARLREDEHPDDAIPLWREEVTSEIAAMSNPSYTNAVALIERIGRLMTTARRGDEFAPSVTALVAASSGCAENDRSLQWEAWLRTTVLSPRQRRQSCRTSPWAPRTAPTSTCTTRTTARVSPWC